MQPSREKLWAVYEKLPKEIKDVVFADETLNEIEKICKQNNIFGDEKVSSVTKSIRDVLFGFLASNEFQKALEENPGLDKKTAKKVSQEISQSIFVPIESVLEKIYGEEIKLNKDLSPQEEIKRPTKKDAYREPI